MKNTTARAARGIAVIAMAILLAACGAPSGQPSAITVNDAWARPAAGGAVGGVYMTLNNAGGADKLVAVTTDVASAAEIHQTSMGANNMMQMAPVHGGLEVPANGSVSLKPGGYHIMLMNLKKDLFPNQTFKLQLKFQSGKTLDVEVPVKDAGGM